MLTSTMVGLAHCRHARVTQLVHLYTVHSTVLHVIGSNAVFHARLCDMQHMRSCQMRTSEEFMIGMVRKG